MQPVVITSQKDGYVGDAFYSEIFGALIEIYNSKIRGRFKKIMNNNHSIIQPLLTPPYRDEEPISLAY